MDIFSVFVTGANRGLGLGLVKHLVQLPSPPKFIFATYRSRDEIQALKDIRDKYKRTQILLIKMDVTRKNEIENARKITEDMVGDKGLTMLINNAGVGADQRFPHVTEENLLYHFKTNTIGPILVVQEFLPLLQKAAAQGGSGSRMGVNRASVINISSILGSISHAEDHEIHGLECPSYSISKTGLNMSMRVIAADLEKQDILVVMICPGWVRTDMGTDKADLSVDESVSAILQTLEMLDESHHGTYMDRNGNPYLF